MESIQSNIKNNIPGFVAVVLFLGTSVYLTVEMTRNAGLKDDLKNEKVVSESMLSEKLLAEKATVKVTAELASSRQKEHDLQQALDAETTKSKSAENKIKSFNNRSKSISRLENKIQALSGSKSYLEEELAQSKQSIENLQHSYNGLELTARLAQEQNHELSSQLASCKTSNPNALNEILIESKKKNNKLTVRSKRTKQLIVHLETPVTANNLSFKITDPAGNDLNDKHGVITVYKTEVGTQNRTQLTFSPKHPLKEGLYTIQVSNENRLISSLQVRLR